MEITSKAKIFTIETVHKKNNDTIKYVKCVLVYLIIKKYYINIVIYVYYIDVRFFLSNIILNL